MNYNFLIYVLVLLAACSEKKEDQIMPTTKPLNVTIVSQSKINNEWVDQVRAQHLQNDTGKTVLVQSWDDVNKIWQDLYKEIYGKHGMVKQNLTNGQWVKAYNEQYLLDGRDSVAEKIMYDKNGNPYYRTVLIYGKNNKVIREDKYNLDYDVWHFSGFAKHLYNEKGEPTQDAYYNILGDTTIPYLKYTYTLDDKGHRISAIGEGANNYYVTEEYVTLPDGRFSSFINTNVSGGGNQTKVIYIWEN